MIVTLRCMKCGDEHPVGGVFELDCAPAVVCESCLNWLDLSASLRVMKAVDAFPVPPYWAALLNEPWAGY